MENFEATRETIKWLLMVAWLLPLFGFAIEIFGARFWDRKSRAASLLAVGCIGGGFVLSVLAYVEWKSATHWSVRHSVAEAKALAAADFKHTAVSAFPAITDEELEHYIEHQIPGDEADEQVAADREAMRELLEDHEHHEVTRESFEAGAAAWSLTAKYMPEAIEFAESEFAVANTEVAEGEGAEQVITPAELTAFIALRYPAEEAEEDEHHSDEQEGDEQTDEDAGHHHDSVAVNRELLRDQLSDGEGNIPAEQFKARLATWKLTTRLAPLGWGLRDSHANEDLSITRDELAAEIAEHLHHEQHAGHDDDEQHAAGESPEAEEDHEHEAHAAHHHDGTPKAFAGSLYTLGSFGDLTVSLDYYVDSLTLIMFMMVTLIATCIHVFAMGYMSDELTEEYVDHHAHTSDGKHVHRPGRYYRFFAFLSLFCFSMLGLVFAGNIFQVFVFWELVGICSYLLIGFYTERKSANVAANKAFIMNRVGDFGFLIGLMVIWTWFGNFQFVEMDNHGEVVGGMFHMLRGDTGSLDVVTTAEGASEVVLHAGDEHRTIPYNLLIVLGLGVFAGCIGKSAQFPLQTWLPDAMEGPTPVSALVHSATMVAAGVYLVGRFYPMFAPEVLLVIAYVGCITLFVAATIAVVATDLKKVLAYSTISQLGYMMLALGVFGWAAGLFHLITHAFFKSLMFLASGSVIVGCHHEQEMPKMGGLLRKMPWTAMAMLVGVIAISGLAIPGSAAIFGEAIAFSGFHSKDAIVATAMTFSQYNGLHFLLFFVPLVTAGITAFYMFRLWFYTFWGQPRDQHIYDHCHESPWLMVGPLVVLSLFAAFCAVGGEHGDLFLALNDSQPSNVAAVHSAELAGDSGITLFGHHQVLDNHAQAGLWALVAAFVGGLVAFLLYGMRVIDPGDIRDSVGGLYRFLVNKWQFDELYDMMFVRPAHCVASWCTWVDKNVFDNVLHGACRVCVSIANFDRRIDERLVDGFVNLLGDATFAVGRSLRVIQTGKLRQYVMFIAVGLMAVFVVIFVCFPK